MLGLFRRTQFVPGAVTNRLKLFTRPPHDIAQKDRRQTDARDGSAHLCGGLMVVGKITVIGDKIVDLGGDDRKCNRNILGLAHESSRRLHCFCGGERRTLKFDQRKKTLELLLGVGKIAFDLPARFQDHNLWQDKHDFAGQRMLQYRVGPAQPNDAAEQDVGVDGTPRDLRKGYAMIAQPPLTNLQMELLKLYSLRLSDEQLLEVKQVLARHFADRLTRHVDALWEQKGLTTADMESWLNDDDQ